MYALLSAQGVALGCGEVAPPGRRANSNKDKEER